MESETFSFQDGEEINGESETFYFSKLKGDMWKVRRF